MDMNVMHNGVFTWKNPHNWFHNLKWICRNFKYAYQRVVRGWADCDVWNLETYYLNILPQTLYYLANNGISFPDKLFNNVNGFENHDEWAAYLRMIARLFERGSEESGFYKNEWQAEVNKYLDDVLMKMDRSMLHKYTEREKEIDALRHADLECAFTMMINVFEHLWD